MKANLVLFIGAVLPKGWAFRQSSKVLAVLGTGMVLSVSARAASVTLAWNTNPEPDVAGYRIYFGAQGGTPTTTLDAGTSTNLVVTGLQEGASYSFFATAYNSAGLESDFSPGINYTVPSAANNLVVTLERSFSTNTAHYTVFFGPQGQSPTSRSIGTNLTTTISNVVRGATYEITADAYNSGGALLHEYEVVSYTIPQSGSIGSVHLVPVDQPPSVALTSPADGSTFSVPANIQITAQATDDDAIKFVDVFAGTTLLARDSAPPYSFTWSNAPAGEHEISVIGVDTLDQFTRSSSAVITVDTAPIITSPAAPSNLTARFVRSSHRARLDWIDASNNEDSFRIERSTANSNFTVIATVPANTVQYFDSVLARGTRYYYRVRSVNSAGSNVSNVVSVRTRW